MFCFVSNQKCSNVPNNHANIFFCLVLRCEQIYFHLTTFLWSASPLHYNLSTVSHGVTHASSFCLAHNSLRAHLFIFHLKIDKYVLNIHHWPHTITSPSAMDGNGYSQPPMSSLLLSNLLAVPVRPPSWPVWSACLSLRSGICLYFLTKRAQSFLMKLTYSYVFLIWHEHVLQCTTLLYQ